MQIDSHQYPSTTITPEAAAVIEAGRVKAVRDVDTLIPVVLAVTAATVENATGYVTVCAVAVVFSYPFAYSKTFLYVEREFT